MATQKQAGIYKGVSESVFPDDILSDQELQGAPMDVRGAWTAQILQVMWRDKKPTVSGTVETFARRWGCSMEDAARYIAGIASHDIGVVEVDGAGMNRDDSGNLPQIFREFSGDFPGYVQKSPAFVRITCRRLLRKYKAREAEKLRKQVERARKACPANVRGENMLPPYPLPPPPPLPVPMDKGKGAASPSRPAGAGDGSASGVPAKPLREFMPADHPLRQHLEETDSDRSRKAAADKIAFEAIRGNKIRPANRHLVSAEVERALQSGMLEEVVRDLLMAKKAHGKDVEKVLAAKVLGGAMP